ncbi:hypothetical protein F2P81_010997 [Scophthalmus maximus]|uniref:Uncharacterized protein n=1 Tax=Scophthalmus maximus TaxID=52904 RepID=A0A6A4SSS7_SCOMX|nr:hypothetical protein F2P81_010997 [Scophthalmus maximus]
MKVDVDVKVDVEVDVEVEVDEELIYSADLRIQESMALNSTEPFSLDDAVERHKNNTGQIRVLSDARWGRESAGGERVVTGETFQRCEGLCEVVNDVWTTICRHENGHVFTIGVCHLSQLNIALKIYNTLTQQQRFRQWPYSKPTAPSGELTG